MIIKNSSAQLVSKPTAGGETICGQVSDSPRKRAAHSMAIAGSMVAKSVPHFFSASAMAAAQEVMASQSRKSPTGALMALRISFSARLSFFMFIRP